MTNFRLFQTQRVYRRQFHFDKNGRKFLKWEETLCEKEKLLVSSNFSLSHRVFKGFVPQTCKKPGFVW